MTREDVFKQCTHQISETNCLLLELPTGYGKSKLCIDLINHLCDTKYQGKKTKLLLLVAKTTHKITWKEQFEEWGGIKADEVVMECYESLHKHAGEKFEFIIADEVHHLGSALRQESFGFVSWDYAIGLSATIPFKVKKFFKYDYSAKVVSCDLTEAIEDDILPEPEIVLLPLALDNKVYNETFEVNPKAKGVVAYGNYSELWKYKKQKIHAILSCTAKQKSNELNKEVLYWKTRFNSSRSEAAKQVWLHLCGQRLEYYSDIKVPIVKEILKKLKNYRTITFCRTIEQSEQLGKNCIHSKNTKHDEVYNNFNKKKINHITAVNILNENANLVDCKYAIFTNLSSSEVVIPQRLGRAMRHKKPVIVVPYWAGTREQEIVEKMFENFNKEFIRTIYSIEEI